MKQNYAGRGLCLTRKLKAAVGWFRCFQCFLKNQCSTLIGHYTFWSSQQYLMALPPSHVPGRPKRMSIASLSPCTVASNLNPQAPPRSPVARRRSQHAASSSHRKPLPALPMPASSTMKPTF